MTYKKNTFDKILKIKLLPKTLFNLKILFLKHNHKHVLIMRVKLSNPIKVMTEYNVLFHCFAHIGATKYCPWAYT
jgi:hypothetical protein